MILFLYRLLQDIEYSSLCYAVGPCCLSSFLLLIPLRDIGLFIFNIYLFIWLCRVLAVARGIFVAACGIFRCGIWDLVP